MELTTRTVLIVATAVAAGINAGSFFAFSNFVMQALGRLAPAEGARAMQEINRDAPNPLFMLTLIGGGASGAALALVALGSPDAGWQLAGGLASSATTVITIGFHVPRNNRLAAVEATSQHGQELWLRYRVTWTRGNHVRTLTSLASLVFLLLACLGKEI